MISTANQTTVADVRHAPNRGHCPAAAPFHVFHVRPRNSTMCAKRGDMSTEVTPPAQTADGSAEDFPEAVDEWRVHQSTRLVGDSLVTERTPLRDPHWEAWND